ncbi:hypothetical protein Tco_1555517 [Tanacetum coccineum]
METTLIFDTITTPDTYHHQTLTLSFTNLTITSPTHHHHHHKKLHITAQALPTDAVAPPPVKPTVIPTSRAKSRARVKRKIKTADEGSDGGVDGGGGGGFFGGGGGSGDGGGFGWDESDPTPVDPAFDFVYELLSWFVLSNCLYFAVKRVVRIVVDGSADDGMSQCETNALYRIWSSDCRVVDAVKRVVRIVVDMSGDVGERRFQ